MSAFLEIIGGLTAFVSFLVIDLIVLIKKKIFQRCNRRETLRNYLDFEDFNEEQSRPIYKVVTVEDKEEHENTTLYNLIS